MTLSDFLHYGGSSYKLYVKSTTTQNVPELHGTCFDEFIELVNPY